MITFITSWTMAKSLSIFIEKLSYVLISLRPKQRIKNGILFFPYFFSGLFTRNNTVNLFLLFLLFSFFVWSTYILNDIKDVDQDRMHPQKQLRPLASWKLPILFAKVCSIFFMSISASIIRRWFWETMVGILWLYLLNTLLYSYFMKHIVIVDVFFIAFGFVLRWIIWSLAIGVVISERLLIILFFGALFLWFLKRYQEVKLWIESTRKNITLYNELFLQQVISIITSIMIIAYTLYTFNSVQPSWIIVTIPVVSFAIIRYYYHIFYLWKYEEGIEDIIFSDRYLLISWLLFIVIWIWVVFVPF